MTTVEESGTNPGPTGERPGAETAVLTSERATDAQAPTPSKPSGTTFETLAVCAFIFGVFAIVVAAFAVGLAARAVEDAKAAGSAPVSAAAATTEVSLEDFAIKPAEMEVAAGAVIKITNHGAVPHDFAVGGLVSDMIDPGASGELDLAGLAPGSYPTRCQVPGHEAAGMKGTLVVL